MSEQVTVKLKRRTDKERADYLSYQLTDLMVQVINIRDERDEARAALEAINAIIQRTPFDSANLVDSIDAMSDAVDEAREWARRMKAERDALLLDVEARNLAAWQADNPAGDAPPFVAVVDEED